MAVLARRFLTLFVFVLVSLGLYLNFVDDFLTRRYITVGEYQYLPSSYDWSRSKIYYPLYSIQELPAGRPIQFPAVQAKQVSKSSDGSDPARSDAVKSAFLKSWQAYKKYAWLKDELRPLTGKSRKSYGWSTQVIDALDTLWILDLKEEFKEAVAIVARIDWARSQSNHWNLFEVTIRLLGGLLSAYDLSGEPVLLFKATELGDMLYMAFDTPNHLPVQSFYYRQAKKGYQLADDYISGAAGGSMCLEFTRLSQLTGNPKYYDATEHVKQFFARIQNHTRIPGLWPHTMNFRKETADTPMFTFSSGGDSLYEYLPKMHAILGGLDPQYEQMTSVSFDAGIKHLLFRPQTPDNDTILLAGNAAYSGGKMDWAYEVSHLSCYAGGSYALAGKILSRDDFVEVGSRLTAGCIYLYDAFPSNIMPEIVELEPCESQNGPCPFTAQIRASAKLPPGFTRVRDTRYLLRPEAIESVFYLWRITGDQVWRDAAWRMWRSIVRESETKMAFASSQDVTRQGSEKDDYMETWWMSETLKYFYLIFGDSDLLNLDDWVFNTQAHPLKRPTTAF